MSCGNCSPKADLRHVIVQTVAIAVSRAIEAQQLAAPRVIPPMGDLIDSAERALAPLLKGQ